MTSPAINPNLADTGTPPIPEAKAWLAAYDGRHGAPLDLSQAAPAYGPPAPLMEALAAAAADPATASYGPIRGETPLREDYARELTAIYGGSIAPETCAIVSGCNQAFVMAAMALARAGDAIILPTPWYFNHKMALDMLGITALPLACRADQGFIPAVSEAEALISPRTRAIVLVTPNNPTGAVYPPETIAAFAKLCAERGIWLILDETYRDFMPRAGQRPHDVFEATLPGHVIQLYSFSKAFALPGYRLGAVMGPPAFMEPFGKVLDTVQICAPRIGQIAVGRTMAMLAGWREGNRAMIAARGQAFRAAMTATPEWRVASVGAYFAYVSPPERLGTGEAVCRRLAETCGLLTLPGRYFGPGQDQWLRVAFANVAQEGLAAIPDRLRLVAKAT